VVVVIEADSPRSALLSDGVEPLAVPQHRIEVPRREKLDGAPDLGITQFCMVVQDWFDGIGLQPTNMAAYNLKPEVTEELLRL